MLRDGVAVALAPKALDTLLALIERRDRVLTKDELLELIWGDTVVEEGGLTRNISVLRKALGETPDDHRFIVTVPGRGYRFVAEVASSRVPPSRQRPVEPSLAGTGCDGGGAAAARGCRGRLNPRGCGGYCLWGWRR